MEIIVGFLSGVLSGMGLGGGMILIPCLTIFFNIEQIYAQSVNLFYFIPTAVSALFVHIKNKNIDREIFDYIFTSIIGAGIGSLLALHIKSILLTRIFCIFMSIFGVKEVVNSIKSEKKQV